MSIIIFILVLAVLILVHELGHFLAARGAGIRVDEFGIGFPPKLFGWKPKGGETEYSLNAIPFGGFVRILGEDADEAGVYSEEDKKRSLIYKSKLTQVWVLAAGVIFNMVFAWLLISGGFMLGFPASSSSVEQSQLQDARVVVVNIAPDSPAEVAGLQVGDTITAIHDSSDAVDEDMLTVEAVQAFTQTREDVLVTLTYERGGETLTTDITPVSGLVEGKAALGVGLDTLGIVQLPIHEALIEGVQFTTHLTGATLVAFGDLLAGAFKGTADLTQVAGPVGIVGLVGDAVALGFVQLLLFTALISINLAIINLVPFPALDGGRILFIIIEAIKGSPIKPKVVNALNTGGFLLLILLMLLVTYNDIVRLITG